jgi:hypothetical protein
VHSDCFSPKLMRSLQLGVLFCNNATAGVWAFCVSTIETKIQEAQTKICMSTFGLKLEEKLARLCQQTARADYVLAFTFAIVPDLYVRRLFICGCRGSAWIPRVANRKKRGVTTINLTLLGRRKQIVGANGAEQSN